MHGIVLGTLRRRWLRSLLVGLSTLIAFMLLGFFLAIRHGFAVGLSQVGADLLLLEPAAGSAPLTLAVLSAVKSFPGVRSAVGVNVEPLLFGTDRHPLRVEGLSPNAFLDVSGVVGKGESSPPALSSSHPKPGPVLPRSRVPRSAATPTPRSTSS